MRPTAAGRRRRCIGSRRRTPFRPRCASTTTYTRPDPGASDDLLADLNPNSETVVTGAFVEPSLAGATGRTVQFERLGYFAADPDSRPGQLVFNRTLTLKDTGQGPGAANGGSAPDLELPRSRRLPCPG